MQSQVGWGRVRLGQAYKPRSTAQIVDILVFLNPKNNLTGLDKQVRVWRSALTHTQIILALLRSVWGQPFLISEVSPFLIESETCLNNIEVEKMQSLLKHVMDQTISHKNVSRPIY